MEEGERRSGGEGGEAVENSEKEEDGGGAAAMDVFSGGRTTESLDLVAARGLDLFAARLAHEMVKETINESSVTKIWSIPCSQECHNPKHAGESQMSVGLLSWTPESSSGQTSTPPTQTCSSSSPQTCSSPRLRRRSGGGGVSADEHVRSERLEDQSLNPADDNRCQTGSTHLPPSAEAEISADNDVASKQSCEASELKGLVESISNCQTTPCTTQPQSIIAKDNHVEPTTESTTTKTTSQSPSQHHNTNNELLTTTPPLSTNPVIESSIAASRSPSPRPDSSGFSSHQNSISREQTDLVHYRLSGRSRDVMAPITAVAEDSAVVAEDDQVRLEYKSAENLASLSSREDGSHIANGNITSLRKGLSVNDVGAATAGANGGLKSSSGGLLRSLGLRRPRDEVTQREDCPIAAAAGQNGRNNKMKTLKKTLTSMFHFKPRGDESTATNGGGCERRRLFKIPTKRNKSLPPVKRALPPVPAVRLESRTPSPQAADAALAATPPEPSHPTHHSPQEGHQPEDSNMDFAASIQKVKDHGWYWGPLSGESAERILAPEPDGSFVVRDSSDHHYIFSLTFKLNGFVRHVRIEHDQGNFSFGSFTKFKSTTIVDFIENAVEHSRSGRYLFFLHRRPVLGPMRVQLLHPVSRFKRVQSLQHLSRYVIVKHVRKDHLDDLPVPNRIKQYLNTPFYYSEQVEAEAEEEAEQESAAAHLSLITSVDEDELTGDGPGSNSGTPSILVDSQRSPRQRPDESLATAAARQQESIPLTDQNSARSNNGSTGSGGAVAAAAQNSESRDELLRTVAINPFTNAS